MPVLLPRKRESRFAEPRCAQWDLAKLYRLARLTCARRPRSLSRLGAKNRTAAKPPIFGRALAGANKQARAPCARAREATSAAWSPPPRHRSARPRRARPSARGTCPRPRRPAGAAPLLSCLRTTPPSRAPRGGPRRPSARGPRPAKGETPSPTSAGGPAPIPSRGACRRLGHWPWRGCRNWSRSSGLRRESRRGRYDGP